MSEMSVSEKLRACANGGAAMGVLGDTGLVDNNIKAMFNPGKLLFKDAIKNVADMIDAEEKELRDFCERLNEAADAREDVDLSGQAYTPLPLDVNGDAIHIGDRVENNRRVARILLSDGSYEPSVYIEESPRILKEYFCNEVSHYHKSAVEDVLSDLMDFARDYEGEKTDSDWCDEIAAAAKKLRLREE